MTSAKAVAMGPSSADCPLSREPFRGVGGRRQRHMETTLHISLTAA